MAYTEAQRWWTTRSLSATAITGNPISSRNSPLDSLGAQRRRKRDAIAQSMILVFEIKGEIQRVAKDAMAFDHRDANFELSIIGHWTDPAMTP